jgi:predicted CoA-binding protein
MKSGRHITSLDDVRGVLERAETIAVLGAHADASRPASYVPAYLAAQGYRIVGVNPMFAGQTLFGETVVARLADVPFPVDIVDVFRLPQLIPGHVPDMLAMQPHPKLVWLQLGIRNDEAARELIAQGIDVVQDRCTLADHRRLGIAAKRDLTKQ